MECHLCREILSARLDGEHVAREVSDAADLHRTSCSGCTVFADDAAALHRGLRVRPAEEVPDLAPAILAAAPTLRARREPSVLRLVLGGVGLVLVLAAVPALFTDGGSVTVHHLSRELAAFQAALGFGFALAAWQPSRAAGLFPMALMVVGGMILIAMMDVFRGRPISLAEAQHAFELAGVVLLGLVARAGGDPRPVGRRTLRLA